MVSSAPSIASDDIIDDHLDGYATAEDGDSELTGSLPPATADSEDDDIDMPGITHGRDDQSGAPLTSREATPTLIIPFLGAEDGRDIPNRNQPISPLPSAPRSPPVSVNARPKRASRRSYIDEIDSDSELSDIPDSDEEIEAVEPRASTSSRSKATVTKSMKETTVKNKTNGRTTSKSTTKKKTLKKKRAQGKGKVKAADSDSEDEVKVVGKKINGKRQLLAKAEYWDDIPEWGEGADSPLMRMPADVLDAIFGLRPEIRVRPGTA